MFINFINCNGGGGSSSAITEELKGLIERSATSIDIPSGITKIGEQAFANCSGLTAITIPANVTEIDSNAFAGNRSLATITFESTTPPTVAADAFSQLPSGVTVNVPEGAEDAYATIIENILNSKAYIIEYTDFSGNTTVWYSKNSAVTYNDPANAQPERPDGGWAKIEIKSVKYVDHNAFLTEDAVEYIFDDAVEWVGCTPIRGNIVSNIPTKITYKSTSYDYFDSRISEAATNLSSITFNCVNAPTLTLSDSIPSWTANQGELFVPNGGKDWEKYRNAVCGGDWVIKDLSGNTMNLMVKYTDRNISSGTYHFYGLIPGYFFVNNSELMEVVLPDTCNDIRTATFRGCGELNSVTIPSTCWRIQGQAFKGCGWLSDITCYATTAPSIDTRIGDESFGNLSSTGTLTVPYGCTANYSAWTEQLGAGWTVVEMPQGQTQTQVNDIDQMMKYGAYWLSGSSYTSRVEVQYNDGQVLTLDNGRVFYLNPNIGEFTLNWDASEGKYVIIDNSTQQPIDLWKEIDIYRYARPSVIQSGNNIYIYWQFVTSNQILSKTVDSLVGWTTNYN